MAKSDHESRLTLYKADHNYRHFGEALLGAASEGRLGLGHINGTSTQEVLWQLGIALTMTRDQITICLSRLADQHPNLISYLKDDCPMSSARTQLAHVINSAICYTEQDLPKGSSLKIVEAFV